MSEDMAEVRTGESGDGASGRPVPWMVGAVAAGVVALAFAVMWFGARATEPGEVGDFLGERLGAATATAEEVIVAITTYDSETIDDRREQLLGLSVGGFRDDYEQLLEGGLGDVLEEEAVTSEGDIVDGPDVGFTSESQAIAVARVVQDVTSRSTPGGRTVFLVVRLGLTLEGETWKADSLKILSQQIL